MLVNGLSVRDCVLERCVCYYVSCAELVSWLPLEANDFTELGGIGGTWTTDDCTFGFCGVALSLKKSSIWFMLMTGRFGGVGNTG